MSVGSRQIVVLSANEQTYYRVARLCHSSRLSTVQWLSDPIQFSVMMNASTATVQNHTRNTEFIGVAVDLTSPEPPSPTVTVTPRSSRQKAVGRVSWSWHGRSAV